MVHRASIAILFLLVLITALQPIQAQNYRFSPYPDLWYNDVDGVRLGLRILGEVEGTFKDGPHRLDAGLWVGSKLPDNPVSYYFSFTEPIPTISDFGSEGNVQLISFSRTGYALHQLRLNKRWQQGFDELDYLEVSTYGSFEKMYDYRYMIFPMMWSFTRNGNDDWRSLLGFEVAGSYELDQLQFFGVMNYDKTLTESFGKGATLRIDLSQSIPIHGKFKIRTRQFVGLNFGDFTLENTFPYSMPSANQLINNEFSRAQGTIPKTWIYDTNFHFAGGGNLRGYYEQEKKLFKQVEDYVGTSIIPVNERIWTFTTEFQFPNPIDRLLRKASFVGDLIELRSYIFFDVGKSQGSNIDVFGIINTKEPSPLELGYSFDQDQLLADSGLGFQFSVNVPDYLGKDRGVFIRYDIPFWLSHPEINEPNVKYRNVIGIGAVFNF